MAQYALPLFPYERRVVNVASVPQRSPFRYPGGKTWLVPYVRQWLTTLVPRAHTLVEPFAGGASIGLTAAAEGLVDKTLLVELDDDVASVWKTIIHGDASWLIEQIIHLDLTHQCVEALVEAKATGIRERALATIVENRVNRGGILAPGAGRVKNGENGRGLLSRWYPETLCRRIQSIVAIRDRLEFVHGDGLGVVRNWAGDATAAFFIDPPYTVAGRRLYRHNQVDHAQLFRLTGSLAGDVLITYDDSAEIRHLALGQELQVRWVAMKTTHHQQKLELLIGKDLGWVSQAEPDAGLSA